MKHNLSAERFGVRLRPVRLEDADFIVQLRNSPHATEYIGEGAKSVKGQQAWLSAYFERANDYLFVIEAGKPKRPVGMLGIYNIDGNSAEWGRWVIEQGAMAGAGSAWLVLHICYELLKLETIRMEVVEGNRQVISFHKRAGYREKGYSAAPRQVGGTLVRMIEFETSRTEWVTVSPILENVAKVAQRLTRLRNA